MRTVVSLTSASRTSRRATALSWMTANREILALTGSCVLVFLLYFCPSHGPKDTVEVTLQGNVPTSSAVEGWAQSCGAKLAIGIESTLTVTLGLGEFGRVRELAEHIAAIVAPNAPRYSVAAYKYACPRTAQSLQRLADICDAFVRGPQ